MRGASAGRRDRLRADLVLFAAALAARLVYAALDPPAPDSWNYYWRLATSVLLHGTLADGGLPVTSIEPLYPIFLAGLRWIASDRLALVVLAQAAVAAAGAVLLRRLTERLSGDVLAGRVAAGLFVIAPYLVRQSVAFIEIPLLTTLLLATAVSFERASAPRWAVVCGLLFGLAIGTRAMVLPLWAAAAAVLHWRHGWRAALALAGTTVLALIPFIARNARVDGSWVPPRHGINLYVGTCEWTDRLVPRYDLDLLTPLAEEAGLAGLTSTPPPERVAHEVDRVLARQALAFAAAHPGRVLRLKALNVAYFFWPRIVPYERWTPEARLVTLPDGSVRAEGLATRPAFAEAAHSLFYGLTALAALVGLAVRRGAWRRDAFLWLALLTFAAVSAIYFPTTRMRAPVEFVLMFYAGCAAAWTWRRSAEARRRGRTDR